MKEHPILFSAPMVRAILSGAKTQTRRVVKGWPLEWLSDAVGFSPDFVAHPENDACPYGQPGDRLWVRETWQAELRWDWTSPRDINPGSPIYFEFGEEAVPACAGKKRPSIHMPRWASRITLEITDVQVERLQEISEADAMAEGCDPTTWGGITAKDNFSTLWESINGAGSVQANPWVWVVSFRKQEAA